MTDGRLKPRAAIYCRISSDPEGEEKGVQRQEEDCRELAGRRGFEVIEPPFIDNDTSASTRSKKARPQYAAMIDRAKSGDFEVILAYSNSRLTRRPKEWEDLIQLWEQHRVRVETVASGKYDLSTADGRATARTVAAWDAAEAERTAERVKRAGSQRAKDGHWHGGHPPNGYRIQEVNVEGKVVKKLVKDPDVAAALERAADQVLAGASLYSIAWELNGGAGDTEGLRTNRGAHWRPSTIRRRLQSPYTAGLRRVPVTDEHGEVVGHDYVQGDWDPILSVEKWEEVCKVLARPDRRTFNPADGSYQGKRALGGLVFCAHVDNETRQPCGRKLVSQTRRPRAGGNLRLRMVCSEMATEGCGLVTIDYEHLESWVVELVMTRLDTPEFRERLNQPVSRVAEIEPLLMELGILQGRWDRLGDALEAGAMEVAEVKRRRAQIEGERQVVQQKIDALRAASVQHDVRSVADALELFESNDVVRQRRFLAWMIERIDVDVWPVNPETGALYASTIARRSNPVMARRKGWTVETDEEFEERKKQHIHKVLRARVNIRWRKAEAQDADRERPVTGPLRRDVGGDGQSGSFVSG